VADLDAEELGGLGVRPPLQHDRVQHRRVPLAQSRDRLADALALLARHREPARRRTVARLDRAPPRRVRVVDASDLPPDVAPDGRVAPPARAQLALGGAVHPLPQLGLAAQLERAALRALQKVPADGLREVLRLVARERAPARPGRDEATEGRELPVEQRAEAVGRLPGAPPGGASVSIPRIHVTFDSTLAFREPGTSIMDDGHVEHGGPGSDPGAVEALLAAVIDRPRDEWESALEEAASSHPELAPVVRRRFEALGEAGLLDQLASLDHGGRADEGTGGDLEGSTFGDFLVGEELGAGAMGVVRRARQVPLDRDVALKLIRPEFALFPNARLRFEREAEAIARLRHDSIAQVHAAGTLDGVAFIAMELVEGEDVAAALARLRGRAPESLTGADLGAAFADLGWEAAVLTIAIGLARALEHAHARGVLHRDIKPSNVIVERDARRAVLVDFGLHTIADAEDGDADGRRLTRSGAAPGTLLYMAPEQLERGRTDERSEVYGLGATLYEMLALQPPFEGESRSATERRIRAGDPDSIRARNRAVRPDLEAVVMKALRREASDRYASMGDLAGDLERVRDELPVRARRAGRLYRLRRFCRREPRLAAAVLAVGAFAIGTPTFFWSLERSHAEDLSRAFDEEREAKVAAQDLALFALDVLDTTDPDVSAAPGPARAIMENALEKIGTRLAGHPVYRALAATPIAHIQTTFGNTDAADALLRDAIATLEEALLGADGRDEALIRSGLMEARARRCELLELLGDGEALLAERRELCADLHELYGDDWWRVHLAEANLAAEEDALREPAGSPEEAAARLAAIERMFRDAEALLLEQAPDDRVLDLAHLRARLGGLLLRRIRTVPRSAFEDTAERALADLERALEGFDAVGHRHTIRRAEAASSAGLAAKYAGDLELAEQRYLEASRTFETRLPETDHRRGGVLVNLSALADRRGDLDRAIELLEAGHACLRGALPEGHQHVIVTEGNLLGTLFRAGRFDGLRERYADFVERQAASLGRRTPYVVASLENLAMLCARDGDRAEATEHLRESVALRRQLGDSDSAELRRAEGWIQQLERAAADAGK